MAKTSSSSKIRAVSLWRSLVAPSGLGTLAIGDPINGSAGGLMLFSDNTGNFNEDPDFQFNSVNGFFQLGSSVAGSLSIYADPGTLYQFGDLSGLGQSSWLSIDDTIASVTLRASSTHGFLADAGSAYLEVGALTGFGNETRIEIDDGNQTFLLTSTSGTNLFIAGGLTTGINPTPFGAVYTAQFNDYHITFTGGAGAAGVLLNDGNITIGHILVVSDLDRNCAAANITLDAGVGNAIVTTASSAQTFVMATNGLSVTLQKVSATQWMLISRNT